MGFLSKLLGGEENEKMAMDLIKGLVSGEATGNAAHREPAQERSQLTDASTKATGPSGFSWGEEMPDEENQFNYNGPYYQYFEEIYRAEFSTYQLDCERGPRSTVFRFFNGDRKALVVELLSCRSDVRKLRRDCSSEGIPYLRFYYDRDGWWNTRSYVITRTRKALEG